MQPQRKDSKENVAAGEENSGGANGEALVQEDYHCLEFKALVLFPIASKYFEENKIVK